MIKAITFVLMMSNIGSGSPLQHAPGLKYTRFDTLEQCHAIKEEIYTAAGGRPYAEFELRCVPSVTMGE